VPKRSIKLRNNTIVFDVAGEESMDLIESMAAQLFII
jgi:hypothetical protein